MALVPGALVCCLALLEGVFVITDSARGEASKTRAAAGLQVGNAFHRVEWGLLEALGVGDLSAAGLGLVGTALASGTSLPPHLAIRREVAAGGAVGAMVAWRSVVTIAVVPWIGFLLVFDPPEVSRWPRALGALAYLAVSMYLLQVLVHTYAVARRESRRLQEMFKDDAIMDANLGGVHGSGRALAADAARSGLAESNVIFSCLPLDLTVAVYAIVSSVASLYRVISLVQTSRSSGGWAFFMNSADAATSTFWLEATGYASTVVIAACAAGAVTAQWRLDRKVIEYEEDLAVQVPARRRCAGLLFLFFVATSLRFALWVPVTGMAMAARDICGWYVQGLAAISLSPRAAAIGAADRCSAAEVAVLASSLAFLALDAYLLSAIQNLWLRSRAVCLASMERAGEPLLFAPRQCAAACAGGS